MGAAMRRLTERNLDRHVNKFDINEPGSGRPFCDITPFISLSAGCVDRRVVLETNIVHRALRTALEFATTNYSNGRREPCSGWVIHCYVITGSNPAVQIPTVAEEIRELNHGRAYSGWYWQGEIAAKINVPSVQLLCADRYEPTQNGGIRWVRREKNPNFCHPAALLPERNML
jgi:hypothetical protein